MARVCSLIAANGKLHQTSLLCRYDTSMNPIDLSVENNPQCLACIASSSRRNCFSLSFLSSQFQMVWLKTGSGWLWRNQITKNRLSTFPSSSALEDIANWFWSLCYFLRKHFLKDFQQCKCILPVNSKNIFLHPKISLYGNGRHIVLGGLGFIEHITSASSHCTFKYNVCYLFLKLPNLTTLNIGPLLDKLGIPWQ